MPTVLLSRIQVRACQQNDPRFLMQNMPDRVSPPWLSVQTAWNALSERAKRKFTLAFHRRNYRRFRDWCRYAGIKGWREDLVASQPTLQIRHQLDRCLFQIQDGLFAHALISNYFTNGDPGLNDRFLELMDGQKHSRQEKTQAALQQLREESAGDAELIDLYEAALRCWWSEHWFANGEETPDTTPAHTYVIITNETMNEPTHEPGPVETPPAPPEELAPLPSTWENTSAGENFVADYEALLAETEKLSSGINRLPTDACGEAEILFKRALEQARQVFASAAAANGWLDCCAQTFTDGQLDSARSQVPALAEMAMLTVQPGLDLEELAARCRYALERVPRIVAAAAGWRRTTADALASAREIGFELGQEPSDPLDPPLAEAALTVVWALKAEAEARVQRAQTDREAFVQQSVLSLGRELHALVEECNESAANSSDDQEREARLRQALAQAGTPQTVGTLRDEIEAWRQELATREKVLHPAALAARALAGDLADEDLLALAAVLAKRRRALQALGLLLVWQEVKGIDQPPATREGRTAFFDQFTAAAGGAMAVGALAGPDWPTAILHQPWIQQLQGDDLDEAATVRLGWLMLVQALSPQGLDDPCTALFFSFRLANAIRAGSRTELLASAVSRISHGQSVRIRPENGRDEQAETGSTEEAVHQFLKPGEPGGYRYVSGGGIIREVEQRHLMPALKKHAEQVLRAARAGDWPEATGLIDAIDPEELWHDALLEAGAHGETSVHFHRKILSPQRGGYVPRLLDLLRTHVRRARDAADETAADALLLSDLEAERARTAAADVTAPGQFWEWIAERLHAASPLDENPVYRETSFVPVEWVMDLCDRHASVIEVADHLIAQYCEQHHLRLDEEALRRLVDHLGGQRNVREVAAQLAETHKCWRHAALLAHMLPEGEGGDAPVWEADATATEVRLREGVQAVFDSRPGEADAWLDEHQEYLLRGHYVWLEDQVRKLKQEKEHREDQSRQQVRQWTAKQQDELGSLEARANRPDLPPDLLEPVLDQAAACRKQILLWQGKGSKDPEQFQPHYAKALEALAFMVNHGEDSTEEILFHLRAATKPPGAAPVLEGSLAARVANEADEESVRMITREWGTLGAWSGTRLNEIEGAWSRFAKAFVQRCNLYKDARRGTFQSQETASGRLPVAYVTEGFRYPRNAYLARHNISLMLLAGGKPTVDQQQSMLAEIDRGRQVGQLQIVFVPGCASFVDWLNGNRPNYNHYVAVGEHDLLPLIDGSDLPENTLRQTLLRAVDVTVASPFTTEGYVHVNDNLFVGRKAELDRLTEQGSRFRICGGRRIGKTSLVRALEVRLLEGNWRVAYCDCAGIAAASADVDFGVAQDVALKLGLEKSEDLTAFHRTLEQALREGMQIAILLDEVDTYINKSRLRRLHGDQEMPLIPVLRGVENTAPTGHFKIVLAGFKSLFFESRRSDERDVSYPFRNWLTPLDLKQLRVTQVNDLLTAGFKAQLGIGFDPDISREVLNRASGHPAFLQFFCQKLLEDLSTRRNDPSVRITVRDVEKVYNAVSHTGDTQTFTAYVDTTLGYNLDGLERAIVLALAVLVKEEGNPEKLVSRNQLVESLRFYFDSVDVARPTEDALFRALQNLVMVSMLVRREPDSYRMAYASYVDILNRLEKAGTNDLASAIHQHERERHR